MSIDPSGGHPAMDYKEHVRTFDGFVLLTKISIVFLVILLAGMGIFLTTDG